MGISPSRPRVALIHALAESQAPVLASFASLWPEADPFNLLDDSLPSDLAKAGAVDAAMTGRFLNLARYAAGCGDAARPTRGILFTCSAFGPAIDRVKQSLKLPVLKPNEAAFESALNLGATLGLVVTFGAALAPMSDEFQAMAQARGVKLRLKTARAAGALEALRAGELKRHDELIADAVQSLGDVDAIVLGQFSMARAAAVVSGRTAAPVLTTPGAAVAKLRALVEMPA